MKNETFLDDLLDKHNIPRRFRWAFYLLTCKGLIDDETFRAALVNCGNFRSCFLEIVARLSENNPFANNPAVARLDSLDLEPAENLSAA